MLRQPSPGRHGAAQATCTEEWAGGLAPDLIEVSTAGGRYAVYVGEGLLADGARLVQDSCGNVERVFVVSNRRVSQLWLPVVEEGLKSAGYAVETVMIGDGERHKSLPTITRLYDALLAGKHDRSTVVIALGGGVVGDTAGFAAATFMRGLRLVHMPTTLLAQVDSSIGGKTAINYGAGKNLVGAFHQPALVLSDTRTLRTLPDVVFYEGMSEVIKTAVIQGEGLFGFIEGSAPSIAARQGRAIQRMVAECVQLKASVVSEDERDEGKRMLLNLGHTFAHALEAACGYKGVTHGEAVAVGLCLAARLACMLGMARAEVLDRVSSLIAAFDLPTTMSGLGPKPSPACVEEHMGSDKKRRLGRLRFVLPAAIGDVKIVEDVPLEVLRDLLKSD